jgi:hypothetical protein
MRDGDWYLGYSPYGNNPGAALTFGRQSYGIDLVSEPTVTFGDADNGDANLPGEDGIRMGRDYKRSATVTFELAVDGVDGPVDRHYPMRPWANGELVGGWTDAEMVKAFANKREGPDSWAGEGVDMLRQVWEAEAVRQSSTRIAWLRHKRAGRIRRLFGRPRKFDVAHSRFERMGYVPCVGEFVSIDGRFYDDDEQSVEMHDYYIGGLAPRPGRPNGWFGVTSQKTATIQAKGRLTTYPRIVIYGPCQNPKVTLSGLWAMQLSTIIATGDYITVDPRPWVRTVIRTTSSGSTSSAADKLTRASPRLAEMKIPPGNWTTSLAYTRATTRLLAGPRVEIYWRDAHAWW